ncbi:MAG: HlyD family efflux transporter periplasmic adaptor subunit [Oscillospiraceae bacterium]|nr:HlyD family efflux transporter periplasmic adaptor subunit [Oscillospiraceae bacterium]
MKPDVKHLWKTKKRWIIGITAGVAAAAVGCGAWYYAGHNTKDPVYVYPFQYIGMTEYWGDSQESHGPVTTDKIQTVFLSDTQNVTEVFVQQGDMVKKGDLLMTFDTTLSDLQLERKRLSVEKLKLQLEDARDELKRINSMKPMVVPEPSEDEEDAENENLGVLLTEPYRFSDQISYDGRSQEKALICWIRDDTGIDDALFAAMKAAAEKYQAANPPDPTRPPNDPTDETTEATEETTEATEETTETTEETTETTEETTETTEATTETTEEPTENAQDITMLIRRIPTNASAATAPEVESFHVVIKVTSGNRALGEKQIWQGMHVKISGSGFTFRLENAAISDHMIVEQVDDDSVESTPDQDFGSGYTAAQIAQMRSDKQKAIKDLDLKVKMADAEYKIMLREVGDGNIYADNDGKVISLLTQEEARSSQQPILKVSGGGGFYVEGFISELEKDKMKPGQEVTVNDWNTGMTYTGTVESIGDFPSQNGYYNGSGNPNASYYPFLVFVDESADLQAGSYVSIQYSSAESQHGIYLENPFLRTEKGRSYVLVMDANGKLEQRWVTTGKSLWGSYTEILEGLSAEDRIAFPYGKNVKPGVAAQEGDMSNLYG